MSDVCEYGEDYSTYHRVPEVSEEIRNTKRSNPPCKNMHNLSVVVDRTDIFDPPLNHHPVRDLCGIENYHHVDSHDNGIVDLLIHVIAQS